MKANELMIGDWVNLSDDDTDIIPCKVVELHTDELLVIEPQDTACDVVGYDMIYPIPLTADLLEKNGFVFREDDEPMYGEYYRHSTSTFAIKMFGGYLVGMCMGEDLELNYVHELQHALRLCGLNELADNFKI